jgi:hypothetical protein
MSFVPENPEATSDDYILDALEREQAGLIRSRLIFEFTGRDGEIPASVKALDILNELDYQSLDLSKLPKPLKDALIQAIEKGKAKCYAANLLLNPGMYRNVVLVTKDFGIFYCVDSTEATPESKGKYNWDRIELDENNAYEIRMGDHDVTAEQFIDRLSRLEAYDETQKRRKVISNLRGKTKVALEKKE